MAALQALEIVFREDRARVMEVQRNELRALAYAPRAHLELHLDLNGVDNIIRGHSTIAEARSVIHRVRSQLNQANLAYALKSVTACDFLLTVGYGRQSRATIEREIRNRKFLVDGLPATVFETASGKKVRPFSMRNTGFFTAIGRREIRRVKDIVETRVEHYRLQDYPGLPSCKPRRMA